jgi:hypothetical protein
MPFKTGVTAAREVRASGDAQVRIAFLTALRPEQMPEGAEEVGALLWEKPIEPLSFLRRLRDLVAEERESQREQP